MNQLEQLRQWTTIVADTGDIEAITQFAPQDATTNPSLIYKASKNADYAHLIEEAMTYGRQQGKSIEEQTRLAMLKVMVNFGVEILKIVPGRVSTEVDARLSFDVEASVRHARKLIALYEEQSISRDRILIKLASTWEGIQAAKILEKEGIHCNMTLMFSLTQAIAAAQVQATLISPFVGRVLDWFKKSTEQDYLPFQDPGVILVKSIYTYYKKHRFKTQIMGASFRSAGEILELAGLDLLTIAPHLLEELERSQERISRKLSADLSAQTEEQLLTESLFRWQLNENQMATEKLSEGIRLFAKDLVTLEEEMVKRLQSAPSRA